MPVYVRALLSSLAVCFAAPLPVQGQPPAPQVKVNHPPSGRSTTLSEAATTLSEAATTLSEAATIRLAQQNAAMAHAKLARSRIAAATAETALQLPNPQLQWQRTELLGAGRSEGSEDQLTVVAPIDFSGRRQARAALARTQVALSKASAHQLRSRAVQHALTLFFAALASEARADALDRGLTQLENASRIIDARRAAGNASGQDSLRLQLEVELARSVAIEARGTAGQARASLASLLDLRDPSPRLTGTLPPPMLDTDRHKDRHKNGPQNGPENARLKSTAALHTALKSAQTALRASETAWIPRIQLQAGVLVVNDQDTELGYVAGLNVALPLFTTNQALGEQANAQQSLVQATMAAAEQQLRSRTASARATYSYASTELQRFEAGTLNNAQTLVEGTTVSFRQGASDLTALLDAQRTQTRVAERQIGLQLQARLAEVALREAAGEFQ